MNPNFESGTPEQVPPPPSIKVIENNNEGKTTERILQSISDDRIKDPRGMSKIEGNDELKLASESIVNNKKLERLVVKGLLNKRNHQEVTSLAALMNRLTEICISLPDDQIQRIIDQFKAGLRSRFRVYAEELGMKSEKEITEMMAFGLGTGPKAVLESQGIVSAARCMRERKKLHSVGENMIPAFYFDNYLDAKHQIDLIEVLTTSEGLVLNLIQIKSKALTQEDIESVSTAHKKWIDGPVMNMQAYENTLTIEPINSAVIEKIITDSSTIQDIFLEVASGKESSANQILFERLGIDTITKPERIWLLKHNLPKLRERADAFIETGVLDEEDVIKLHHVLDGIEKQISTMEQQKKDLRAIVEVHSICVVDGKEVSNKVVFSPERGVQKVAKFIN
jgi:hypothetical protein